MAEEKQHQALYRRYRPQTPSEVLGQDHVVRALTGAIKEGRLHHAFLFCGPRGTGKTSTARILAKMVNCENGPTAEPCGVCSQCVTIKDGTHLDVVEIDAASHGGVDDARELREKAPTAPVQGREKVYIIDEAQRLSNAAFDALLKVFEEPPPGVRFVLATTEPQKMPATIVGRCQRFDFRRLSAETLAGQLQAIAGREGVTLTDHAAEMIARHAEGSARDALSLLDQASVMGGLSIDEEVVSALLGSPSGEAQYELADAIAAGDTRGAMETVNRVTQEGQDLRNVTGQTLMHFRNLLLTNSAPDQPELLDVGPEAYESLRIQATKFSTAELARVISLLLAAQNDMRWTTSPRLSLELALVRATMPDTDPNVAGLLSRIERLERLAGLKGGAGSASAVQPVAPAPSVTAAPPSERPAAKKTKPAAPVAQEPVTPAEVAPETEDSPVAPPEPAAEQSVVITAQAASAGNVDVAMLRRSWPSLLSYLGTSRKMILRAVLEAATVADYDGETVTLAFPPGAGVGPDKIAERQSDLQNAFESVFGIRPLFACEIRNQRNADSAASVEIVDEEEAPDEAEAIRRLQDILGAQPSAGDNHSTNGSTNGSSSE